MFIRGCLLLPAEAWRQMGREKFSRHVVVLERWRTDTLPTTLIKMQPWLPGEVEEARQYMIRDATFLGGGIPGDNIPSDPIASSTPYHGEFVVNQERLDNFTFWLGTYGQSSLEHDVIVRLSRDGSLVESFTISGRDVTDNGPITMFLTNPIETNRGERLEIEISSTNQGEENRFALWLDRAEAPYIDMRGTPAPFVLAFDPINLENNLIPSELLDSPFPTQAISGLEYKLNPVSDNNPYFAMIRDKFEPVSVASSRLMDGGTASFLNDQLRDVLSAEWLSLYIVGAVSVIFFSNFYISTIVFLSSWSGSMAIDGQLFNIFLLLGCWFYYGGTSLCSTVQEADWLSYTHLCDSDICATGICGYWQLTNKKIACR